MPKLPIKLSNLPKNEFIGHFFKTLKEAKAYARKKGGARKIYVTDRGTAIVV